MTARERVIRVLKHEAVDRFPNDLWALPGIRLFHEDKYQQLRASFEWDMTGAPVQYGVSPYAKGTPDRIGSYVDEFGSVRYVAQDGLFGEIKEPVISDWSKLDKYQMPWNIIQDADYSQVNKFCEQTDQFVLNGSMVNPFERLQYMRGTENLLMDLALGEEKLFKLIDLIHEFNCLSFQALAKTDVDGISFMDDWGTQKALLISPVLWRSLFKPLYKEYIDIAHAQGKYVFFHSDGFIEAIYGDLVEIGIDAINSQLFCMDYVKLIELYGDKITFWGEIDRQYILPFGTMEEVYKAIDHVSALIIKKNGKRTGAFAQCEWGLDVGIDKVKAVFQRWGEK